MIVFTIYIRMKGTLSIITKAKPTAVYYLQVHFIVIDYNKRLDSCRVINGVTLLSSNYIWRYSPAKARIPSLVVDEASQPFRHFKLNRLSFGTVELELPTFYPTPFTLRRKQKHSTKPECLMSLCVPFLPITN